MNNGQVDVVGNVATVEDLNRELKKYPTRDAASIAAGKALGVPFWAGGLQFIADPTGTVCDDIGVSGVAPAGGVAYPEHAGCTEGGDNAAKLDALITWCRAKKIYLCGRFRTYPITTAMTSIPGDIDLSIDASGLTAPRAWQPIAAAFEASQNLTADTLQGQRVWNATAHGYAAGDVVLITSDKVFETGTNAKCAHWGRVSTVTANTFTTNEAALCNLKVAEGAIVRRLPASAPARIKLKMIGGPNCKNGFWPTRFTDLKVSFEGEGFSERAIELQENYRPYVPFASGVDSDTNALGYVLGAAGNGWPRFDLVVGRRARHSLTTGASGTIPSVGGSVGDVIGHECLGACLDTHPATLGFVQTGKTAAEMSDELVGEDGMVWQGVGGEFDVTFSGEASPRHGVLIQPMFDSTAFEIAPSYHFKARGINASDKGVALDLDGCGAIDTIDWEAYGKSVNEFNYVDIGPIAVETLKFGGKGVSTSGRAMRIICEANTNLGFVMQSGEWKAATGECIYSLGQTNAASRTTQWAVSMLKASGGTYGLRATNKVNAVVGAAFLEGSSGASIGTGGATVTTLS